MNQPDNWFYVYTLPLTPAALTIAGWAFLSRREKTKRISERKSKRIETAAALTEKITAAAVAYYLSQAAGSEAAALRQNIPRFEQQPNPPAHRRQRR